MTKSTTSFLFPDVNVWLALSVERHSHHRVAAEWLERERQTLRLCFCRFTQMGLLRLLTTVELMGKDEVQTHQQAWRIYDSWMDDERVVFIPEPADLEVPLRNLTQLRRAAPQGLGRQLSDCVYGNRGIAISDVRQSCGLPDRQSGFPENRKVIVPQLTFA